GDGHRARPDRSRSRSPALAAGGGRLILRDAAAAKQAEAEAAGRLAALGREPLRHRPASLLLAPRGRVEAVLLDGLLVGLGPHLPHALPREAADLPARLRAPAAGGDIAIQRAIVHGLVDVGVVVVAGGDMERALAADRHGPGWQVESGLAAVHNRRFRA